MKVTVITVCFNSAKTIARTLESVRDQSYPDIEHVIVDGGSTDGTMEIVCRFPERLGRVVSEPDGGIYDAMNKGVGLAKGDWLLFLNSDDWLAGPDVIERAVARFDPERKMQHGKLRYFHANGAETIMGGPVRYDDLRFELKQLHQPCCFFHRSLFEELGGFDPRYRVSSDYDLMRRFARRYESNYLDLLLTNMSDNGASASQQVRAIRENVQIARQFGESYWSTTLRALWVRFWLNVRYQFPSTFFVVKSARDTVRRRIRA